MTAIYKRDLKAFFHSFIGWLYVAVMLFMMGIYFTIYNMMIGWPTISYALQSIVFLIIITIPILTMRTLAEERKYKTDQLILTAPVSVGRIVIGKYLALVTVFAVPVVVMGITPLFLRMAGAFQTGLSYTSLLGFFLYGCLGLAIGLFLSSLTESVVIAAVLTMIALFLGYIMSGISSIIASYGTGAFAEYVSKVLYCFDMVGRFDAMSGGYFQVESVAYFVTVTLFVLFCTTQSIQKRRYAVAGKGIRLGAYSIFNVLVAAALTVIVNLGLNYVPDRYTAIDVTANKIYTLTEETVESVSGLAQDVTIYVLTDEASKDGDLDKTLQQIAQLSDHITVEYISPVANPKFYYKYTEEEPERNSLIVVGEKDSVVVNYDDIYAYELNYATYNYEVTGYDGEGQVVAAINRVIFGERPQFYMIAGHGEQGFDEKFAGALEKENVDCETLNLYAQDAIPEDADGIIINAPTSDYSSDDADKILDYLDQGGNAFIIPTWTGTDMDNLDRIIAYYGVSVVDGIIVEGDSGHFYQSPYDLFPDIVEGTLTEKITDGAVFAPLSRGLRYDEASEDIAYDPLLITSLDSFSKTEIYSIEDYSKSDADPDGPFVVGVKAEKPTANGEISQAVIVASGQIFTSLADDVVPGYNVKLFGSILASLSEREVSVSVPVKYYEIGNLAFSARTVYMVEAVYVFILPIGCLLVGFIIWFRRRKR